MYTEPNYPDVRKANGLTNAICNYIKFVGGVGNRINVQGRLVESSEKTISGATLSKKKFIKSSTIKGTADIIASLPNGKTAHLEIKVGKDNPRPEQLQMQERIRNTNGIYEFISTIEQFYNLFDNLMQ